MQTYGELLAQAVNDTAFNNPWVTAWYGWIAYNIYLVWRDQHKFDTNGNGYSWKEFAVYMRLNLVGMIFSLSLVPVMVYFGPKLWELAMKYFKKDWIFEDAYYLFVGLLVSLIQFLVRKFSTKPA